MRQMIVGGNGFIGNCLGKHLRSATSEEILSVVLRSSPGDSHTTRVCDVSDPNQVAALLKGFAPERIYFFAGSGRVGRDEQNEKYFRQNFLTICRFLEAVSLLPHPFQLFFASTMHIYGNPAGEVTEATPVETSSYYGFSKYLGERAIEEYSKAHPESQFIIGRLYTCIGPGQAEGFVVPDLCRKIQGLPKNGGDLMVRSPEAYRQFMDVRDISLLLPRLWDAKKRSAVEKINLASPQVSTIREIAASLIQISGVTAKVIGQPDPHNPFLGLKVRPEKLSEWVPDFTFRPLKETLHDVWQHLAHVPH